MEDTSYISGAIKKTNKKPIKTVIKTKLVTQ